MLIKKEGFDTELIFPESYGHQRIVDILKDRGYTISKKDAEILWNEYSYKLSANWIMLDGSSDEQIFNCLKKVAFFEGIPNAEQEVFVVTKDV